MHDEWTSQAEWMRAIGATSATWSGGALTGLVLGPVPHVPKTQSNASPDEPKQGAVVSRRIGSVAGLTRRAASRGNE